MPVDLEKLLEDYNRSLDDMKPAIKGVGEAWSKAKDKNDEIGKGCDSLTKTVQGDDLGFGCKEAGSGEAGEGGEGRADERTDDDQGSGVQEQAGHHDLGDQTSERRP